MCGRYALFSPAGGLLLALGISPKEWSDTPRYNIAPGQEVPIIRQDRAGERHRVSAQWGLVPSWAPNPKALKHHPINARAEEVANKPMFRRAFRSGRVLVPASGFYEWQSVADRKYPWFIRLKNGEPMVLAALLEHWRGEEEELWSMAILTTSANSMVRPLHDRMPVIIAPQDYATWLDPALHDPATLTPLLAPFPAEELMAYKVDPRVGNPKADDPSLVDPVQ
jgi:putative SOS response-associated peptidase YedK